jgi:outer membrane protein
MFKDFTKIVTLTILLLGTTLSADTAGAEIGYSLWSSKLTGNIQGGGATDDNINLDSDLGHGDTETNGFYWLVVEHPVPLLPNLKLQKTTFESTATAKNGVTFEGTNHTTGTDSKITLNQVDVTMYWSPSDNWVNFDLGLNLKQIKGTVDISTSKKVDVLVPMLYAKGRFDMPFSGLSLEGDINYISYSDSSLSDIKFGFLYETDFGLGANLGYRIQNTKFDDNSVDVDISTKGLYCGLYYHF